MESCYNGADTGFGKVSGVWLYVKFKSVQTGMRAIAYFLFLSIFGSTKKRVGVLTPRIPIPVSAPVNPL